MLLRSNVCYISAFLFIKWCTVYLYLLPLILKYNITAVLPVLYCIINNYFLLQYAVKHSFTVQYIAKNRSYI